MLLEIAWFQGVRVWGLRVKVWRPSCACKRTDIYFNENNFIKEQLTLNINIGVFTVHQKNGENNGGTVFGEPVLVIFTVNIYNIYLLKSLKLTELTSTIVTSLLEELVFL